MNYTINYYLFFNYKEIGDLEILVTLDLIVNLKLLGPMKKIIFIIVLVLMAFSRYKLVAQPAGYTYAKQITIDNTKVAATQTNFPVLINIIGDANLKSIGNGGNVQNINGYDIIFTSGCNTVLKYQIEKYDPVAGSLTVWVNIPSLSSTVNTLLGMYYGNASIVTDPSTPTVWDANYMGVWHYNNGVLDGTSNARNLTDNSTSNSPASKIGDGRSLGNSTNILSSAAGKFLQLPNSLFTGISNFTFEGWVYLNRDATSWERIFDFGQNSTINFFFTPSDASGSPASTRARITTGGGGSEQGPIIANPTANTGAWIHWSVVKDNTANTLTVYKNGASYGSAGSVTLNPSNMEVSTSNYFGKSNYGADHYIDAQFDEFRISSTNRPASWIATAYNNQNSPSTFYSISSQVMASTFCSVLPIELINFNVHCVNNHQVLKWTTMSESNNNYFLIEHSSNGIDWLILDTLDGAGNSLSMLNYEYTDTSACNDVSFNYYRFKQVDYNGAYIYSSILDSDCCNQQNNVVTIYPNPSTGLLKIIHGKEFIQLTIIDTLGQVIYQGSGDIKEIDLTHLAEGSYVISIDILKGESFKKKWAIIK